MSPEVALLVRAALLGLLVVAIEHVGKRRQARRAELRRKNIQTVIRLPETRYPEKALTGRPVQIDVAQTVKASVPVTAQPTQSEILRLEPCSTPPHVMGHVLDGHVTEKRAA